MSESVITTTETPKAFTTNKEALVSIDRMIVPLGESMKMRSCKKGKKNNQDST